MASCRFQLSSPYSPVDCIVSEDALRALGRADGSTVLSGETRRFLEAIAAEKLEWSQRALDTIVIGAGDIAAHRSR